MQSKALFFPIIWLPMLLACGILTQFTTDNVESDSNTMTGETIADANVIYVRAVQADNGSWTFHVTVAHPDTGWDDYADGWDVVLPDGTVVLPEPEIPFTRLLLHPHVDEQPFTRSQSNIMIPAGITQVTVRAHDLVDGWGGQEIMVELTVRSGEGFEVVSNSN